MESSATIDPTFLSFHHRFIIITITINEQLSFVWVQFLLGALVGELGVGLALVLIFLTLLL